MATSKAPKQPAFPHPPLEVGVPQYPTPLVPDFYTKNGHIILVVKESVDKGTYNPMPLDGSVTYSGRDANKWPSTLYLVAQRPTEDSEFVFNYYANDRTLASQQPWNYNISYSEEAYTYPAYTRQYIVPRTQYAASNFTGVDPVFGTATLTKLEMAELPDENPLRSRYVAVQATYEILPGPLLTGHQYDPDLNLTVTNTKQIVAAGASPVLYTNGLLSYRDEPIDANKSARIITTVSSLPSTRTEYKTGSYASPNLITNFGISLLNTPTFQTIVTVTPVMRAKRSYQTVYKTVTSFQYGASDPTGVTLFDPLSVTVLVNGLLFNLNIPDSLCNNFGPYTITTLPNNPVYGYISDTLTVNATNVTATQYLGLVGTYKLISYEQEYWKANIYRNVSVYVLLK